MAAEKKTITKGELMDIYAACRTLGQKDVSPWWELTRNMQNLESEVNKVDEAKKALAKKYAKKGSDGTPIVVNNMFYDFGDNKEKVDKMLDDLSKETVEVELFAIDVKELKGVALQPNVVKPLLGIVLTGDMT